MSTCPPPLLHDSRMLLLTCMPLIDACLLLHFVISHVAVNALLECNLKFEKKNDIIQSISFCDCKWLALDIVLDNIWIYNPNIILQNAGLVLFY